MNSENLIWNDYVLATKYSDGDPQDPWCVGFYAGILGYPSDLRYTVVGNESSLLKASGFSGYSRIKKITCERGRFILRYKKLIQTSDRSLWWWVRVKIYGIDKAFGQYYPELKF